MATLNFHRLIMEKNENWHLLLFRCRYFDESFSEMFVEWYCTKHIHFVQTSQFDWLSLAAKRLNLRKNKKNKLLRSYIGDKAETIRNGHSIILFKTIVFIAVAYALWLL